MERGGEGERLHLQPLVMRSSRAPRSQGAGEAVVLGCKQRCGGFTRGGGESGEIAPVKNLLLVLARDWSHSGCPRSWGLVVGGNL